MQVKFNACKIMQDGSNWLCLNIDNIASCRNFIDNKKDMLYIAEIKEYREKRSLNANAYAWKLITEIANVLRNDKDSIYLQMLHSYGQSDIVSVKSSIDVKGYFKYYSQAGQAVLGGVEFTHYKVYKGSSEFDTREMAILIDGIVSECKAMNIDTATPEEHARMIEEWK